jgi:hypothetical protein
LDYPPLAYPDCWFSMGRLGNVDVVYEPSPWRMFVIDGRTVENWAVGVLTLVIIDLEGFAGNGQEGKFSDHRSLKRLRMGRS